MTDRYAVSFCPEHGPHVKVDEDGCCIGCGCTAVGRYIEQYFGADGKLRELEAELDGRVDQLEQLAEHLQKAQAENARLREENERVATGEVELLRDSVDRLEAELDHAGRPQGQGYDGNDPYAGGLPIHTVAAASDLRRRAKELVARVDAWRIYEGRDIRTADRLLLESMSAIRELAGLEEEGEERYCPQCNEYVYAGANRPYCCGECRDAAGLEEKDG